jgi:hypothetical protein
VLLLQVPVMQHAAAMAQQDTFPGEQQYLKSKFKHSKCKL